MPHILCRVVWAPEYKSRQEKFFAGNMKYPQQHNTAHELLNFSNENGYAYGFVQNKGDWINLENLGAKAGAPSIEGVTVIWCALDEASERLRVVGWYDEAIAYQEPQTLKRSSARGNWAYQFKTKSHDAHIIPETERYLEVPMRAKRTDKGYIGQRNWFFPERYDNYRRFLDAFSAIRIGFKQEIKKGHVDRIAFEEGQRQIAEINIAARNPRLVLEAKKVHGYRCQVCDFSFEDRYGVLGKGFIEVHHLLPIAARKGVRQSTTEDVRVVCANCHRMIHRTAEPMALEDLRKLLR